MVNESGMTGLDSIYDQLSNEQYDLDQESITKLAEYVKEQRFDTESMDLDLQLCQYMSNIASSTSDDCIEYLFEIYIKHIMV